MPAMATDWLERNDFFIIEDITHTSFKFCINGITHTFVYSTAELAKKMINGYAVPVVRRIHTDESNLGKMLSSLEIAKIVGSSFK